MRKIFSWICAAVVLLSMAVPAGATETEAAATPVEIRTPEELQQMALDPAGSYVLMNDLDMSGITWKSLDFQGILDGNGHTIFNLTLSEPGDEMPESMDGNFRTVATRYVGLFGTLRDAQVKNLALMGVKARVESEEPCFLGGIAGYMDSSTITNCSISGILELRAHERIFGLGGVVGFGKGSIENCNVDVTLICTDTDPEKREEQFMGGVLACGFAIIRNCNVTIDGYCSEFGYCHNGGLVGMLVENPMSKWYAKIQDNTVTGKITFFEKNADRRAYCKDTVGENIAYAHSVKRNKTDFIRDERKEYEVELRPEMCPEPSYTSVVVPQSCDSYGYTTHTCEHCGYTYTDSYTLAEHIPGEWTLVREATIEETGLWTAQCPCGLEHQKEEPRLDPPPTTEPTALDTEAETVTKPVTEATEPVQEEAKYPAKTVIQDVFVMVVLVGALVITLVKSRKK